MKPRFVKALLLVAPLLASGVGEALAQSRFGPMIGANMSSFRGSDAENSKDKVGFLFGLYGQFELSPRFAIQPQVLYTMKGSEAEDIDAKVLIDYIQVPVLAQIRFPGSASATPYLIAGPALAFKVSCKAEFLGVSEDCADDDVAGTDFSLIGGAGIDIGQNLTVAVRYDHGLTKVPGGTVPDNVYNRAFSLTIGYGVRLSPVR